MILGVSDMGLLADDDGMASFATSSGRVHGSKQEWEEVNA